MCIRDRFIPLTKSSLVGKENMSSVGQGNELGIGLTVTAITN